MHCIQNSPLNTPSRFNKTLAGLAGSLAITTFAIGIMGLTASKGGPFNAIVSLGQPINGFLLGTSIFVLILDLVWIMTLCKKKYPKIRSNFLPELPREINAKIFSYLQLPELANCMRVNKEWNVFIKEPFFWNSVDLKTFFPSLNIFEESHWKAWVPSKFELSTDDIPSQSKYALAKTIKQLFSSVRIENNLGFTLLTIPKGLTINKVIQIAQELTEPISIDTFEDFIQKFGDVEIKNSYRILISNHIVVGTRSSQLETSEKDHLPKVIEIMTLLVTTFMLSKMRLYPGEPTNNLTYTFCRDQTRYGDPFLVGGFYKDEITLLTRRYPAKTFGGGYVHRLESN